MGSGQPATECEGLKGSYGPVALGGRGEINKLMIKTKLIFQQALFALDSLAGTPFRMYWAVTVPFTCAVFGLWVFWTLWRNKSVPEQELKLDESGAAYRIIMG